MLLMSGCAKTGWQSSEMGTDKKTDKYFSEDFSGDIPVVLNQWKIVADISDLWWTCNYGYILQYTKMSIDKQNNIWIYGPDLENGPIGGISDNPGCTGSDSRRIVVYYEKYNHAETYEVSIDSETDLASASGWTHLDNERVLLNSVFLYKSPWDGPDGGKDNRYIDIAILENGVIRELLSESNSTESVPDYTISNNLLYIIFQNVNNPSPQILVYDLKTEKQIKNFTITNCEYPKSIEISEGYYFLLCSDELNHYTLHIYSEDFIEIPSLEAAINSSPILGDNGLPLNVDSKGRVWIGYSYIMKMENGKWVLDEIFPDQNFIETYNDNFYSKPIFGMVPYKNGMLFSIDKVIFFADYDNMQWKMLKHNGPPLPIVTGPDGKIYIFTGKYILTSTPEP